MQVESSASHLKIKRVPYLASSARFTPSHHWNWLKKRKNFAMCTALRNCALSLICLRFRMERGHRVDRTSYTLCLV